MSNVDVQHHTSKTHVIETQDQIATMANQIETLRQKLAHGHDASIELETLTMENAHAHAQAMTAHIAKLVQGLDDKTTAITQRFENIRAKTRWERVVGIFSAHKSDSRHNGRLRSANINGNLQELIAQSGAIMTMLESHLDDLSNAQSKAQTTLIETINQYETRVAELDTLRAEINKAPPDGHYNTLMQNEYIKLTQTQSLGHYIEKIKTWVDSLKNQAATQRRVIHDLQTGTKQRATLYQTVIDMTKGHPP